MFIEKEERDEKDFLESWFEKQIRLKNLVKSDDYKNWLIDTINTYKVFSDEDFLYKNDIDEKLKEYSSILSYFFSYVKDIANEQNVLSRDTDCGEIYFFKLKNKFYEIELMVGQGSITFVKEIPYNTNCIFVLLDEEVSKEELKNRKLCQTYIHIDESMNVKCAKDHINQINKICEEVNNFEKKHEELSEETGFLCDVVAFLCDYKKTLEHAIEKTELDI